MNHGEHIVPIVTLMLRLIEFCKKSESKILKYWELVCKTKQ